MYRPVIQLPRGCQQKYYIDRAMEPNKTMGLRDTCDAYTHHKAQGLRADQLPDFSIDQIQDVNIYADKPKRSNNIQNDIVVGELQQKITYIPNSKQAFNIPPIKLNWWNTQTDKPAIAQLKEINIQVAGNMGLSKPFFPKSSTATTVDHSTKENIKPFKNAFYGTLWFWIACVFLVGWLVTLWLL